MNNDVQTNTAANLGLASNKKWDECTDSEKIERIRSLAMVSVI